MDHEAKCILYNKDIQLAFKTKTPFENIPILFAYNSSSSIPGSNAFIQTADIVLWVKFVDSEWFRPYGGFSKSQITKMIEICKNDLQVDSLMSMLAAASE